MGSISKVCLRTYCLSISLAPSLLRVSISGSRQFRVGQMCHYFWCQSRFGSTFEVVQCASSITNDFDISRRLPVNWLSQGRTCKLLQNQPGEVWRRQVNSAWILTEVSEKLSELSYKHINRAAKRKKKVWLPDELFTNDPSTEWRTHCNGESPTQLFN